MCGYSATGKFSLAPGPGCAYTRYCVFPRSQNLSGIAGSSDFRRCAPVALGKQGPHHRCVVIIQLQPLRPWGWRGGGDWGFGSLSLGGWRCRGYVR